MTAPSHASVGPEPLGKSCCGKDEYPSRGAGFFILSGFPDGKFENLKVVVTLATSAFSSGTLFSPTPAVTNCERRVAIYCNLSATRWRIQERVEKTARIADRIVGAGDTFAGRRLRNARGPVADPDKAADATPTVSLSIAAARRSIEQNSGRTPDLRGSRKEVR